MNLKSRINQLETRNKPKALRLVICSTAEEARHLEATVTTVIITGVPRHRPEAHQ